MHELRGITWDTCVLCGVAVDAEDGTVRFGETAASTIKARFPLARHRLRRHKHDDHQLRRR